MVTAQGGNGGAYRRLPQQIDPWLRRFYARRLQPAMVEDAAQDALIAIHAKRHTYAPGRPFWPWLAAIARYKWIDRLRAMNRNATDELGEADVAAGNHEAAVTSASVLHRLLAGAQARAGEGDPDGHLWRSAGAAGAGADGAVAMKAV